MTKEIAVLENKDFGNVRTLFDDDGKAWFVANDIAKALGYSRPGKAVADHCKHAKLLKGPELGQYTDSPHGVKFIPEGDVYRLITRSQLPEAVKFELWLFDEALPKLMRGNINQLDLSASNAPQILRLLADNMERVAELEANNADLDKRYQSSQMRLGEHPLYHKVSEDPYIKKHFDSRMFGFIGRIMRELSDKMKIPVLSTPHPVVGQVAVYSSVVFEAFIQEYGEKPEFLVEWRIDNPETDEAE